MRPSGFHHLAIQVRDLDRSTAFYGELLGLEVIARPLDEAGAPRATWLALGEGFLALERCDGTPAERAFRDPAAGLHLIALRIEAEQRAAWQARLAEAGHPTCAETDYTFYVRDPEGNRVGLSHHPAPRAR